MIIDVLPNSKVKGEVKAFSYLVPKELEGQIKLGQLVMVPFGPRKISGIVSGIVEISSRQSSDLASSITYNSRCSPKAKPGSATSCGAGTSGLKPITSIVDPDPILDDQHIQLAQWLSDYYFCDFSQALFLMLPRKLKLGKKNIRSPKRPEYTPEGGSPVSADVLFTPEQQAAFEKISNSFTPHLNPLPQGERKNEGTPSAIEYTPSKSLSLDGRGQGEGEAITYHPTGDQPKADNLEPKTFLLHGVTGSGKTEIYLASAKLAKSLGRQSIVLVPEIAITAQTVEFFKKTFSERLAVFHSQLSEGQKLNVWEKCRNGEIDLVIGPRSALFLPLPNIGLIVLDEEQDSSYKSDQTPRYHARTCAEKLVELTGSTLILGSATPSIETFFRAQQGEFTILELHERYRPMSSSTEPLPPLRGKAGMRGTSEDTPHLNPLKQISPIIPSPLRGEGQGEGDPTHYSLLTTNSLPLYSEGMPEVKVVDMRNEFHYGNKSVLSEALQTEIQTVLNNKRQTFLFMNRRGAATFILCRDCGYVESCPKCEVPLTLHLSSPTHYSLPTTNFLLCHHCSTRYPSPAICPKCQSQNIRFFGTGTQKVEMETKKLFPKAKITRLDLDSSAKPEEIYQKIKNADIVIGTQLIAKNWDLPKVDLVGIVSADAGLNLPDFRAAENAFQSLIQVAGRAGRREQSGKVIIQTYDPENSVIQSAAKQDYLEFYAREIESRKKFGYPPFSKILRLVISHEDATKAKELAEKIYSSLIINPSSLIISLSVPFYSKLHNKFRYQIILKSPCHCEEVPAEPRTTWQSNLQKILSEFPACSIDIDPISLL